MTRLRDVAIRQALRVTGSGTLTILLYHRVLAEPDELFPSTVDARRFDAQMAWLRAWLAVLPLGEAVEMLRAGRLPAAAACVTFDDGYADNARIALPILARHRIPATFFVASGYLDGGRMWNDTIIEALRRASGPHADLRAHDLGRHALDSPRARRAAIDAIVAKLKYEAPDRRAARVDAVAATLRVRLPGDLMMTPDEVRVLHRAGMEIGGHTVTHPILARLDDAAAREEMRRGREQLQAIAGAPVTLFAYPNGRPGDDYDARHVAMARDLGFRAALTTRRAAARRTSDPFEIPRFTPFGHSPLRWSGGFALNHVGIHRV